MSGIWLKVAITAALCSSFRLVISRLSLEAFVESSSGIIGVTVMESEGRLVEFISVRFLQYILIYAAHYYLRLYDLLQ